MLARSCQLSRSFAALTGLRLAEVLSDGGAGGRGGIALDVLTNKGAGARESACRECSLVEVLALAEALARRDAGVG